MTQQNQEKDGTENGEIKELQCFFIVLPTNDFLVCYCKKVEIFQNFVRNLILDFSKTSVYAKSFLKSFEWNMYLFQLVRLACIRQTTATMSVRNALGTPMRQGRARTLADVLMDTTGPSTLLLRRCVLDRP